MAAKKKDTCINMQWVKTGGTTLLDLIKKCMILHRNQLDDDIINFAQKLLKKQFPSINGLQNTLLQAKKQVDSKKSQQHQVVHCRGNRCMGPCLHSP